MWLCSADNKAQQSDVSINQTTIFRFISFIRLFVHLHLFLRFRLWFSDNLLCSVRRLSFWQCWPMNERPIWENDPALPSTCFKVSKVKKKKRKKENEINYVFPSLNVIELEKQIKQKKQKIKIITIMLTSNKLLNKLKRIRRMWARRQAIDRLFIFQLIDNHDQASVHFLRFF